MRFFIPAVLGLAVVGFASSARALDYELDVRPGVGGAGSKSPLRYNGGPVAANEAVPTDSIFGGGSAPYDAGFALQLALGVRLFSIFSVGLNGDVRFLSTDSVGDVRNITRNAWSLGPYARAYIPLPVTKLEPWVGIGVSYVHDTQNFDLTTGGSEKISTDALAIPVSVGVLYPILGRHLEVGPSFTYAPVFPSGGCVDGPGFEHCVTDGPASNIVEGKDYGMWTLGLDIQATFP